MIFTTTGNITLISQENSTFPQFVQKIKTAYAEFQETNIIINLFSFERLNASDLLEFLELSNTHRGAKKSFVLVTNRVAIDDIPEEISVAPTLQEANDIVEMEEIERDLDLF